MELILASASPARLKTLRGAGLDPQVVVSDVAEESFTAPEVADLAAALARAKAEAVAARLEREGSAERLIVGCDSLLEFAGEPLGKPVDAAAAIQRWQLIRGGSGWLHTGHQVLRQGSQPGHSAGVGSTRVQFAQLSDAEIEAYVATGEPLAVAGAFTIDGLGGPFIERIEGDPHNVIGLSLPLLRRLFAEVGVAWTTLWRAPEGSRTEPRVNTASLGGP